MRFATLALCAAVAADNILPEFVRTTLHKDTPFLEFFDPVNWQDSWITSKTKKVVDGVTDESLLNYRGKWNVEEPTVLPGIKHDHALVVKSAAAHSAISVKFDKPINPKGKDLVIQYEVKFQNKHDCGGAYMKLLTYDPKFDPAQFSDKTPYTIMFGPDKCGNTNKVHFIFRHRNPLTKEWEEKHMNSPPAGKFEKLTGLYTLIVHPDNTFKVLINNEEVKKGSLLEDFTPSVNPDKEIDDVNDTKPADWVDDGKIQDPSATKPEDWDEDAPMEIEDMDATQPADWLSNEPLMIPDPEAEKPEDWDDEEDGDWTAPSVPNPACEGVSGCGPWTRPMKRNPEYKGLWTAPMIDNPDFIGAWKPRKVENPNYFQDLHPADFTKIGALGFELWTMNDGITFDNIYIGHSIADAAKLAKEQWEVKYASEKLADSESKAEEADKVVEEQIEGYLARAKEFKDLALKEILGFIQALQKDPVQGIKSYPLLSSGAVSVVVLLLTLFGLFAKSGDVIEEKKEKKEKKEKVEAVDEDHDEVVDEKKKDSSSPLKSRKGKKKDSDDE